MIQSEFLLNLPVVELSQQQMDEIEDYHKFPPTDDQRRSAAEILRWLSDPDPENYEHLLEGFAGTGKTTLVQTLCSFLKCVAPDLRIGICAYSNNAKNVVRRTNKAASLTVDTMTCCQMLGLRMSHDAAGNVSFRPDQSSKPKVYNYDLIIVDEGYGIDSQMYKDFSEYFNLPSIQRKILYVGDPAQTGPIGELHSPITNIKSRSCMTEVRRHDGPILDYATSIREDLNIILPYPETEHSQTQDRGLWARDIGGWSNIVGRAFRNFHEKDPWDRRIFCFTNNRVRELNQLARSLIYEGKQLERFMPRERIVFTQPYDDFCISDEGTVIKVENATLSVGQKLFNVYRILLEHEDLTDFDGTMRSYIHVLAESSLELYNQTVNELASQAQARMIKWEVVYAFKGMFASVDYAYALTIHKGKGSTCKDAFVDVVDCRKRLKYVDSSGRNGHIIEYNRLIYTAATRAADRLFLRV